jgi:hypothetical protein
MRMWYLKEMGEIFRRNFGNSDPKAIFHLFGVRQRVKFSEAQDLALTIADDAHECD